MSEPDVMTPTETAAPPTQAAAAVPPIFATDPPTHWLQRLMDNPWLLLILGVVIPTLSYTIWGLIDLMMIPAAPIR